MADEKNPRDTAVSSDDDAAQRELALGEIPLSELPKGRWDRSWPVIACGAGLFSDGERDGTHELPSRY